MLVAADRGGGAVCRTAEMDGCATLAGDERRAVGTADEAPAVTSTLVGRDEELRRLLDAHRAADAGRGGVIALVGEAGIGKSRLAAELGREATRRGARVLVGRAVDGAGHVAYRPVREALLVASREPLPDSPAIQPFLPALGALVPAWRAPGPAPDTNPVVLGEGLLRLLAALGGPAGTVLVLEDLHWADPETVAVVEYLADTLAGERVLVLVTLRSEVASDALARIRQLAARRAATVVSLARLGRCSVDALVREAAGGEVPGEVLEAVFARSEGVPLLAEELAACAHESVATAVPDTLAGLIGDRLRSLPAPARSLLEAAALVGRRVELDLVAAAAGVDDAVEHLGVLTDAGLVETDTATTLRFRHPLLRDTVRGQLLAPRVREVAARAAALLEARPTLDDEERQLAAELRETAGDREAAALHLLAAGRRAHGAGALKTAERALRRARALAEDVPALRQDVEVSLTETLAAAARTDDALAIGRRLADELESQGDAAARLAALHLALARAAVEATRWAPAREHLAAARSAAEAGDDAVLASRVDVLAANLAMDEGRPDDAVTLARSALARGGGEPEVAAEAHGVLGRRERLRDLTAARAAFERQHAVAERHDLRLHAVRALHELGTIDMFTTGRTDRLEQARDLAAAAGAVSLTATVDLQLTGAYAFQMRIEEARVAGRRCLDIARPLRLERVHLMGLVQCAFGEAMAGDGDAMEALLAEAAGAAPADPEVAAMAAGHCRAWFALLRERRRDALAHLDGALTLASQRPSMPPGIFPGVWALVSVLDTDRGVQRLERLRAGEPGIPVIPAILDLAEAVLEGRAGDGVAAARLVEAGDRALRAVQLDAVSCVLRRHVAEAALADGWGEPVAWLHATIDRFEPTPHTALVDASYALLRRAGVRRRRGEAPVPPGLRRHGLTPREAEVLRLVGERLPNREIAARLFLSTRTVEKHVENLLAKTGCGDRAALADLAAGEAS